MEVLTVKKEFINTSNDLLTTIMQNINDSINGNKELLACIVAGCGINTSIEKDGNNYNFVVKTKNKVSILKDEKGNVYSIIEKKD